MCWCYAMTTRKSRQEFSIHHTLIRYKYRLKHRGNNENKKGKHYQRNGTTELPRHCLSCPDHTTEKRQEQCKARKTFTHHPYYHPPSIDVNRKMYLYEVNIIVYTCVLLRIHYPEAFLLSCVLL